MKVLSVCAMLRLTRPAEIHEVFSDVPIGCAAERGDPSAGPPYIRGRAYLTLARALRAQGRRDEARAALASALKHLEITLGPDHPDTQTARQLAAEISKP
jgi:hypothetical protein